MFIVATSSDGKRYACPEVLPRHHCCGRCFVETDGGWEVFSARAQACERCGSRIERTRTLAGTQRLLPQIGPNDPSPSNFDSKEDRAAKRRASQNRAYNEACFEGRAPKKINRPQRMKGA